MPEYDTLIRSFGMQKSQKGQKFSRICPPIFRLANFEHGLVHKSFFPSPYFYSIPWVQMCHGKEGSAFCFTFLNVKLVRRES